MEDVVQKFQQGLHLFSESKYNDALAIFSSLVQEKFSEKNKLFKMMAYKSIASIYTIKNDFELAIKYSKMAFKEMEKKENLDERVNSLLSIGNLYADAGEISQTIKYYEKTISLYDEEIGTNKNNTLLLEKAVIKFDLGVILLEKKNQAKALESFQDAIEIYDQLNLVTEKANVLIDIAKVFHGHGLKKQAYDFIEKAVSCYQKNEGKARILLDSGKYLFKQSDLDKGIEFIERGLQLIPNSEQASNLEKISEFFDSIREFSIAIGYLDRALLLYTKSQDKNAKSTVLGKLGNIYSRLGQIERSITYYEESISINEELHDFHKKAISLLGLGAVLSNKGRIDKALSYFNQALSIFEQEQDENYRAKVLHLTGRTYNKKGDIEKAIFNYNVSLDIYNDDEYKNSIDKAICLHEMGNIFLKMGNYEKAEQNFSQALAIHEKYNHDPLLKAEPLVYLGLLYTQKNELKKAETNLKLGFELLSSRANPFDILNLFDELFVLNEDLAYQHALSIPLGLLWIFSKKNDLIEANQIFNPKFWFILKKATEQLWTLIFADRVQIIKGFKDKERKNIKTKRTRKTEVMNEEEQSIFIKNWRLFQLVKSTQDELTNETTANMLFGSNDLETGYPIYDCLRDVQIDLEPLWFVEVPLKLHHGEKFLKIRLNNRIKHAGKLIGYPLLKDSSHSIKSIKITFETQWLQRFVIDHLFMPNDQYEYEAYEINPANAWLTDSYIMDLGENSKKFSKIELMYKIEFEIDTKTKNKTKTIFKSTNKRIIIPIYKTNNFQRLEQYIVRNSNALAFFIAGLSFFFGIFDISGQFINYPAIFTRLDIFVSYLFFYALLLGIFFSPFYIWGKYKLNTKKINTKISDFD